jgi:hypothetical protein
MTTAIIAALHFGGNFERARQSLQDQGYIPQMLGKSRFNRRVHRISHLMMTLFNLLGETWKELNEHSIYVWDSQTSFQGKMNLWPTKSGKDWLG